MWIKKRHAVATAILRPIFLVLDKLLYGFTPEKYKFEKGKPYLVLSNHQTTFDQFMINTSFPRLLYFVASEDIFSHGFVSSIISFLVAPIPKSKAQRDFSTIRNCMRVAKEGGAICVCPEGNRTYSGTTEHMDPAIAKLAQALNVTLVLYNIEGGFGVDPRWGHSRRKGKMRGFVKRVISPDEIKKMSTEEIFKTIREELYVDSADLTGSYTGGKRAEYVERALYFCPNCKQMNSLRSDGNKLFCDKCDLEVEYTENLRFKVIKGECPYETVKQWYDAQKVFIKSLDPQKLSKSEEIFSDDKVSLLLAERMKPRKFLASGTFTAYADRLVLEGEREQITYMLDKISDVALMNRNELDLSIEGKIIRVRGTKRFNNVKYFNLFYHFKHLREGKEDELLGL